MPIFETDFGPVHLGENALNSLDEWLRIHRTKYSNVCILTDETVHSAVIPRILGDLEHLGESSIVEVPQGEASKSPEILFQLWMSLLENRLDRHSLLISIGGGVVTDLGGFLASTYMRGIEHVLVPTSLLAMVDASIGGKSGINVQGYKNLVGSFAKAKGIFAWTPALNTLPEEEWRCGFGECVKHAFLKGGSLWASIEKLKNFTEILPLLPELVQVKMEIVKADPFEHSETRMALNLGHTIGHALESGLEGNESHGNCVAAGLWIESVIAEDLGLLDPSHGLALRCLIDRWWTTRLPIPPETISYLHGDKKNRYKKIQFILPKGPGQRPILTEVSLGIVEKAINSYV